MSATSLSEPEDEPLSPLERWMRLLGGGWIFVLLIALIAIFTTLRPEQFGSGFNLSMLAINAAILLVLSVGQTFVIIAGGIDLSVGAVLVFASIASAQSCCAYPARREELMAQRRAAGALFSSGSLLRWRPEPSGEPSMELLSQPPGYRR